MGLNEEFLKNPLQFGNLHTLIPAPNPIANASHIRRLGLTDGTEVKQVQGDNKVAFVRSCGAVIAQMAWRRMAPLSITRIRKAHGR